jgi:hypothetical protein
MLHHRQLCLIIARSKITSKSHKITWFVYWKYRPTCVRVPPMGQTFIWRMVEAIIRYQCKKTFSIWSMCYGRRITHLNLQIIKLEIKYRTVSLVSMSIGLLVFDIERNEMLRRWSLILIFAALNLLFFRYSWLKLNSFRQWYLRFS